MTYRVLRDLAVKYVRGAECPLLVVRLSVISEAPHFRVIVSDEKSGFVESRYVRLEDAVRVARVISDATSHDEPRELLSSGTALAGQPWRERP